MQPPGDGFSPLLIGARCSALPRLREEERALSVSVPSSSGHGVQPATSASSIGVTASFSPLLIGARCSALAHLLIHGLDLLVSVPSSSGHGVQLEHKTISVSNASVSVPSSSGHGVQRVLIQETAKLKVSFQSPPHRGTVFSRSRSWPVTLLHCFSPLLIGARCSAIACRVGSSP